MKKYYTRYLQLSDKSEKQEYQLLVINFNEKKYKTVIEKAKILLQEENSDVPVEIYKYLGFSYFQMNNLKEAYASVTQYLEVQDSAKLKRYDFYLAAQVASRIKEKDSLALSYIINEFNADTAAANRKFYAIALVNHFIKAKDGYNTALWSEKLLPYRGINKVDLYRIGVTWYNIDELDKADSILTDFLSRYPAEYKGIYMKAGILAKKDSAMSAGLAVPYFESFIDSVHNSTKAEYKPMLEQSYNYLGGYYLKQKDYDASLTNYSSLLKLQPANKEVKKAIADIKTYLQKVKTYEKNKKKKGN
ncbi:MAG: tetratricopeptide repeat protein [Chitinophagaceae bacterium]|nr:tetratricopeptide repeat protein [Chitinophagaceae bacterium]